MKPAYGAVTQVCDEHVVGEGRLQPAPSVRPAGSARQMLVVSSINGV
jgi:hypothetical protein